MQHRYRFAGLEETVLTGLSHGVNAVVTRLEPAVDEDGAPVEEVDESTVVVRPGDEVETVDPYPHAHMINVDTGEPDPHDEAVVVEKRADDIGQDQGNGDNGDNGDNGEGEQTGHVQTVGEQGPELQTVPLTTQPVPVVPETSEPAVDDAGDQDATTVTPPAPAAPSE